MQRTVHEALELRDVIVACETAANKLLHAVSTVRDPDVVQMLGAHERTFRQQSHQLKLALKGEGGLYGAGAHPAGGTGVAGPAGPATFSTPGMATGLGGPLAPGGPGGPGSPLAPTGAAAPGAPVPPTGWSASGGPGAPTGPAAPGGSAAPTGPAAPAGSAAPAGPWGPGPVHPAEAGGSPGYPPTGPGTYSYRPSAASPDHRYPAGADGRSGPPTAGQAALSTGPSAGAGPASRPGDAPGDPWRPIRGGGPEGGRPGQGGDVTRHALRADRPELVGWEPGAGNNEGWQAGARREPTGLTAAVEPRQTPAPYAPGAGGPVAPGSVTAFDAPGGGTMADPGAGAPGRDRAASGRAGRADAGSPGVAGSGGTVRSDGRDAEAFTAVRPVGYGPGAAPGEAGGVARGREEPTFRGHWAAQGGPQGPGSEGVRYDSPRVGFRAEWSPAPWTGPAAGSTPVGSPPVDAPGAAVPGPRPGATEPAQAAGVRLVDPDALAVADCLQDCKHLALRMVVAATEASDRHLRRTLYQMAGQHLEMAEQHYQWLRGRGLYTVPPATPDLLRQLEDDLRRAEQAVRVLPAVAGEAAGGPGGTVNTDLAGYPSGGLKGAFGGQQIRD